MSGSGLKLPSLVRRRALARGAAGARWLAELPVVVARLKRRWRLRVTTVLAGGTEALVLAGERVGGGHVVVKIPPGDAGAPVNERRALELAGGLGYVKLLAHDAESGALLLERLGAQLAESALPVSRQIDIVVETLQRAWRPVADPAGLTSGNDKARWLADYIRRHWPREDPPAPLAVRDRALEFAQRREAAHSAGSAVLVHGDCHAWNTLGTPGDAGMFKFIDPDGLFAEPAYDLGILMREWDASLLDGDPAARGRQRCEHLAACTGVDPDAIWQWGFVERVSSGLALAGLGARDLAASQFAVVTAWASV